MVASANATYTGVYNIGWDLEELRGIRYGQAPLASRRFARSQLFHEHGDVDAQQYSPGCLRPDSLSHSNGLSEDCLSLNIV